MSEQPSQDNNTQPILLVDDDKFLLEMYGAKFREQGRKVELAFGGEEALRKLRDGLKPEAIVLDIVMPNVDGFELMEAIKNESLGDNPVIIALTNQGEETDINRAHELGAHGYIIKASSIPSEVLEKVETIIKEHTQ
jgi:CheY-like chemotaxis protein